MSDLICVTNRKLCRGEFLERMEHIAGGKPRAVILREKDMEAGEYYRLAEQVTAICKKYQVPCILHSFVPVAERLRADGLHLPLGLLRERKKDPGRGRRYLGTSCHTLEEAKEAESLGCTYLIAGHIFATDCKKNLPPRGLSFLENICSSVSIPVYAIGGISPRNIAAVRKAGARGGCVMSGLMECTDVQGYMEEFNGE